MVVFSFDVFQATNIFPLRMTGDSVYCKVNEEMSESRYKTSILAYDYVSVDSAYLFVKLANILLSVVLRRSSAFSDALSGGMLR